MKTFFAILLFVVFSMPAAADWLEGTVIGVQDTNSKQPVVIFTNTFTGANLGIYPPNEWSTVDLSELVPPDTISVFLSGMLVITHGITLETCNLTVAFRAPGDNLPGSAYIGQAIEATMGAGQRSTMATWVPVYLGQFEFHWTVTPGQYPTNCAYAVNLSLQAYVR